VNKDRRWERKNIGSDWYGNGQHMSGRTATRRRTETGRQENRISSPDASVTRRTDSRTGSAA